MILFRYLASEMMKSLLAITVVLLSIVVSLRLARQLSAVARGDLSPDFLFLMLLYRIPGHLEMILPMAFFIAVLLVVGRLAADNEVTVMRASGISDARLAGCVLAIAVPVAVLMAGLSLALAPAATATYERLDRDNAEARHLRIAVEGRFRVDADSGRVSYVEQLGDDGREMRGVFIAQPQTDSSSLVLVNAEHGRFGYDERGRTRELKLDDGTIHVGAAGEPAQQVVRFRHFRQQLRPSEDDTVPQRLDAWSSEQLLAAAGPEARAVLQWRLSMIVLVPVAALLALALVVGGDGASPRSSRFAPLLPALLLYLAYVVVINAVRDALAAQQLAAATATAVSHLPFLALGVVLLFQAELRRRWRRR